MKEKIISCLKRLVNLRNPIAALYGVTVIIITILTGHYYYYITSISELKEHLSTGQDELFLIEIYVGLMMFVTATYFLVAKITKKYEAELLQQATYDSLTGLPNRSLLKQELKSRLARAKKTQTQLGLFFIDLDDFKQVNDTYNHQVGDQLLIEVSRRFESVLRADDFVARLGGDEFVVITNNYDAVDPRSTVDVERVAQQIHQATTDMIQINDIMLYSNSSIGISVYPCSAVTETELLRTADLAMYQCKKQGKNQHIIYTPEIEKDILEEYEMGQQLRKAIIDDQCKDFYMVYQPQFSPSKNYVIGFEALVRWNNDMYPDVGPAQFIPIVESMNLIDNLGECLLDKVLTDYTKFRNYCKKNCSQWDTFPLKVSVNTSAMEFNSETVDMIYRKIMEYKLEPRELEIEITESTLVEEMHELSVIEQLNNLGIGVSIDDFGTGFSSLKKLSTMPFNCIKIDKAFIDQIGIDIRAEAVILMILILGQELEVTIVAEGVETKDQLDYLIGHCPDIIIQGYIYSTPVKASDLYKVIC